MRAAIASFLIAMSIIAGAAPADAVASDATDTPEVLWPIPRPAETSGPITVQLEGAKGHAWGIRKFAHEADKQIPGLRIFIHGKCSDRPRAMCVHLTVADYGDTGWGAVTQFTRPEYRDVFMNTYYDYGEFYAEACHEFGHVLGMQHHKMHGVDGGWPNEVHLSDAELDALHAAYPRPK